MLPDYGEARVGVHGQHGRLADILLNVLLFAPLGAVLGHHRLSAVRALLIGTAISSVIEILQTMIPGRVAGVGDVLPNAAGTVVGLAVWRTFPWWARPPYRTAWALALTAGCLAGVVVVGTGVLLRPSFPPTSYFGHWAVTSGTSFSGRVLDASIGGTSILFGPIPHSPEVRARLAASEPLTVHAIAGPRVTKLTPILSINDRNDEILWLGSRTTDLVYRFRTRAASLGFDSPDLRVVGGLRDLRPGDPLTVGIKSSRHGYCIDINQAETCGIGFTPGWGWALLLYGQDLPAWGHGLLTMLWMAGLTLPVGFWARGPWQAILGLAPIGAGILLLPAVAGLLSPGLLELVGSSVGLLGGALLGAGAARFHRRWCCDSEIR
jgi:hypothetical protein